MLKTSGGKLPHDKGIVGAIAITVLAAVNVSSLFTELHDHMYILLHYMFTSLNIAAHEVCRSSYDS